MSLPPPILEKPDVNIGGLATRTGRTVVAIAGIIGGAFLYWQLAPIRNVPEFWIGVIGLPCLGFAMAIASPWLAKKAIGVIGLEFTVLNAVLHLCSLTAFWCDTHFNNGGIQQQPALSVIVVGGIYWLTIFPGIPGGFVLSLAGILRESGVREGKRGLMLGSVYWLGMPILVRLATTIFQQ